MAFKYADRVKETTTSTGTGAISLSGAVSGFQSFLSGIGANNTCFYSIAHQASAEWEVGLGTLDMMGTTLTRSLVQASSSLGSLVSFSSGTKDVFVTIPARAVPGGDLVAGGRLTLGTGQPYQLTIISSNTLYYTPASSSTVYLWTGNNWVPWQLTSDLSITNSSTAASKIYDISINWNSGSPTLVATLWSSFGAGTSARATAITYQDQIPMISGNRYIGTVFTDATNLFTDSSEFRYIWNVANRAPRYLGKTDGNTQWTYASTTYQNARATASNRVSFVIGISDWSMVHLMLHVGASGTAQGLGGISTLSANSTGFSGFMQGYNFAAYMASQVASQITYNKAEMVGYPPAGYNYVQWCERILTSGTTTFYGATDRSGIQGWVEC